MSAEKVRTREIDSKMAEIYKDFLPERIFDAHIHMYFKDVIPGFYGPSGTFYMDAATPEDYTATLQPVFPGVKQFRLNMMPMPDLALNDLSNGLRDQANGYVASLANKNPEHVASAYILPSDTEEMIGDMVADPMVRAMKPYAFTVPAERRANAAIGDFLPEAAWVVANAKRIPIILHMMRAKSLSDPDNLAYINDMTARYPDAPLVLAHCARGFASWTAVNQIRNLADHNNIWFDMAAICESGPMMASIMKNHAKRVMWGTDWPICLRRGRAISMTNDQLWLSEEEGQDCGYALMTAESLLAFYQTAILLDLDQTQIDDIFYHNACALFDQN